MKSAVFLDRDGVINGYRPDYVKSWDEFVFLPGTIEAIRRLAPTPYAIVVVTNQSSIARGIVDREVVDCIHHRMTAEIMSHGGRLDEVVYCPHHPDEKCVCRKPQPGMLLEVAFRQNLDLQTSFFIGDSPSDVKAANASGCKPVLVLTGRGKASKQELLRQYPDLVVVSDLLGAVEWILAHQTL